MVGEADGDLDRIADTVFDHITLIVTVPSSTARIPPDLLALLNLK